MDRTSAYTNSWTTGALMPSLGSELFRSLACIVARGLLVATNQLYSDAK